MRNRNELEQFYKNKKVLVTGHTGFKGSWLCMLLNELGANVAGYSLEPPTSPSLFNILGLEKDIHSYIGDIRNLSELKKTFEAEKPEIVIHMAAQPIVRESYRDPVGTYEINVIGTLNVLECCRLFDSVKSVVNVTTDKVYKNNEWDRGYVETDILDGYDPYSNSKSCSELVTSSYKNSFFGGDTCTMADGRVCTISTCRAGNVIGGGDFAKDRIIPDCFRAAITDGELIVRNPYSTRPYQHVLDPLYAYLMIGMEQWCDKSYASNYNVGPNDESCVTTGQLSDMFCDKWNTISDKKLTWKNVYDGGPHEANFLRLDCGKLKSTFEWQPVWNIQTTMDKTTEWYLHYDKVSEGSEIKEFTVKQIKEFLECLKA